MGGTVEWKEPRKDPYCPPGSLCNESKISRRRDIPSAQGEKTRRSGTGRTTLNAAGGRGFSSRKSDGTKLTTFYDHDGQPQYYDEDGNKYQPSNKARNRSLSQDGNRTLNRGGSDGRFERMLSGGLPNLNNIGRNFTNAFQQNLPNPRRPNGGYVGTYKNPDGGYVDLYKAGRAPPGMKRK